MKRTILLLLSAVLLAACIVSAITFVRQYRDAKNSEAEFAALSQIAAQIRTGEKNRQVPMTVRETQHGEQAEPEAVTEAAYGELSAQNADYYGWVRIADSRIDYPVMYTPYDPDYYLTHSFKKETSKYGVPYLDSDCSQESNNLVIYGHNMKNGTMFGDLVNYTDREYCLSHPYIYLDTEDTAAIYEVLAAFPFDADADTFCYNDYTDMNEADFAKFMENVHIRQLYPTGADAQYGDRLLTLSTCEYSYENGRFVVVAKLVG